MTDDLLDALARDIIPRPARRVGIRLALALAAGAFVSLVGVMLLLGPRADFPAAFGLAMFWTKLFYVLALAAVAVGCVERLARPGGEVRRRVGWLAAPVAAMALAALAQWILAPTAMHQTLLMGDSAAVCPWLIITAAAPIFVALAWAMRGLAPTRLRAAGGMAGLVAGAAGAAVYAFHCREMGGAFVLVWYSLGVLAPGAFGWLAGPTLLRWR
ncbi:MAG TPA: DUF1109 domain-containing protein [Caulobacteraceae bacterium]|jgi:hypothetical protein